MQESVLQKKVVTNMRKCNGCGSNMIFDPESQKLLCKHCGSTQSVNLTTYSREIDITSGFFMDNEWKNDENDVFECDNCGAKVVLSRGETAKECPFCRTPHVVKISGLSGVKPNAIIPFTITKEKANEYAGNWAKKGLFVSSRFKKSFKTKLLDGVYVPAFTFDSVTASSYNGKIGITKTKTVGYGKNRRTVTYTEWRMIYGNFYRNYDDILTTGGSKFGQDSLDKISPYKTNASCQYEENFLLGYMAYHYDKGFEDCWSNAKSIIDKDIRRAILSQYHYDTLGFLDVKTSHSNVTFKYVMLPVYMGNYNFKGKNYNYSINGTTGKIYGKKPISALKVLGAVLAGLSLVVGIGLALVLGGVI